MTGQSITLQAEVPNVHEEVIQWAHNNTIIAHWDEEEQQTKCLFLNTEFDKQTLSLTISDLKSNWSGFYAFKINNDNKVIYQVTVTDAVSQPNITQVCNPSSCTLTCKATEDEHSQYTWTDSRGERKDGPVWTVENRAEDQDVTYTCNISNPVSWKIETFTVPGRIAYEIILGIGSAVLVVLVLIGIGSYYCRKRKTGKLDLKTGQSSPETEERSIPMRNNDNTVEHIELSQKLLGQRNGASNRVHWHATHAENGDASHEVSINLDELSVINNGTVAELPNGTCSEATIQTDDASNSVHGHATNAENGDASHEVVINLHVGAELMPQ
ncbi:CD48 antigen-like isoform X2 [Clupea harengus]|uniref:CD48 antigen-like isoform X2 n=1 Tax=Clupea harengus TaxID=7950 RepID=A0A8M1KP96_CLUHA|nr:CD48 antigen-like isoform X2 [Clupea harengus]